MGILKRILVFLIALTLLVGSFTISADEAEKGFGEALAGKEIRGVFADSLNNKDFPSRPDLTEAELKAEINAIIAYSAENDVNTIFFKACAMGDALYNSENFPVSYFLTGKQGSALGFDPLSYFISRASANGIDVYAWINPAQATLGSPDPEKLQKLLNTLDLSYGYTPPQIKVAMGEGLPQNTLSPESPAAKHPEYTLTHTDGGIYYDIANPKVHELAAKEAALIVKNYGVEGVVIEGDVYPDSFDFTMPYTVYGSPEQTEEDFARESLNEYISYIYKAVKAADESAVIGVTADINGAESIIAGADADFIVPRLYYAFGSVNGDFLSNAERLSAKCSEKNMALVPAINSEAMGSLSYDNGRYACQNELLYEITALRNLGASGHVYSDATSFMANPMDMSSKLYRLYLDGNISVGNNGFSVPKKLTVARPEGNINYSYSSYFILGTSNPELPLYVNGEKVENRAPDGSYGVLVQTPVGTTTVKVTQGDKTVTRKITRYGSTGEVSTINKITQSSMLPTSKSIVKSGDSFTVKCVAPSGAEVTASIGGSSVTLKQVAATAKKGVPATFKGELAISGDHNKNETTDIGPVTYTLRYNGKKTTYTSTGSLHFAGANTTPAVATLNDITMVYKTEDTNGKSLTNLRKNAIDFVVDQNDEMFKLAMGGWIKKSAVTVIDGPTLEIPESKGVAMMSDGKTEGYQISGGGYIPYRFVKEDGKITVYLYNIKGISSLPVKQSDLFSGVTVTNENGVTKLEFTLKEGKRLGGWNVEYIGDDSMIYFKQAPKLASGSKPLSGITVVLDPVTAAPTAHSALRAVRPLLKAT